MSLATVILVLGMVGIFLALFVSLTAVGAFDNEARGVSKSLAVVQAFSTAPSSLQEEFEPPFRDRVLLPFLDRLVGIGRRFTPADHADRVRQKLECAGNPSGWTVDRVTALKVVGFGGMLGLSILFAVAIDKGLGVSLLTVAGGTTAGYFAPNIYLYNAGAKRAVVMRKTFPDALDLLTISVEAGLGFDAALAKCVEKMEGPLVDEFRQALAEVRMGRTRREALRDVANRADAQPVSNFIGAIIQAEQLGVPIAKVLQIQSNQLRIERRQRAEEAAAKAPVKMLFPMVGCIFPTIFIVILGPAIVQVMGGPAL